MLQTHCKRGHEFTPENTYVPKDGGRHCRACRKSRHEANPRKYDPVKMREWRKGWRQRNPHWHRDYERQKKLGITPDETQKLLEGQEGKCAICEDIMDRPCLDHNHVTNKVRGLLCSSCNLGIGSLKDSPLIVEKALYYLLKHW